MRCWVEPCAAAGWVLLAAAASPPSADSLSEKAWLSLDARCSSCEQLRSRAPDSLASELPARAEGSAVSGLCRWMRCLSGGNQQPADHPHHK